MTTAPAILTLTTRGDELDRTGTVGAAQLLRYLEYGRWRAMTTGEGGLSAFFAGELKMVVRAQRIRLGAPVGWNETLRLQTWLARVGRTSMDFGHVLVRESDGARVCEAILTAVQIDAQGRPAPLAETVVAQAAAPELDQQLTTLTFAETLPDDAWTWQQTIRPSQIDLFRHVNHSRYVDLFEDARWFMERAHAAMNRQLSVIALEYRREAKAGEDVTVALHARDAHTLDGQLLRGGEILTRAVLQVRD
jgi:acyl-CoA thioesterase FadM